MAVNHKVTGRAMSMPGGMAMGGVTSLVITLLGAGVLSKLVEQEIMPETSIGYGVMMLLMMASFGGSVMAYKKIKRQRLAVCMASGGIYFLTLLAITALFFGGQYSAVIETALLVLCGSVLAVMLGLREKRGGKRGRVKVRTR